MINIFSIVLIIYYPIVFYPEEVTMSRHKLVKNCLQIIIVIGMIISMFSFPQIHKITVLAQSPQPPWLDTDWLYRKEIAVNEAMISADLTNFPVLISLNADADLASKAQDDGDDILFTDSAGDMLNHEIEYFDGSIGKLLVWVNVPHLSSTESTYLYMYYGNDTVENQENPAGVWDSDFVMVQHLEETSGNHYDSTAYANDGIPQNGLVQGAIGKIGNADDFAGINQFIDVGTQASMDVYGPNQDFSIFLWVKRDVIESVDGFFSSGSSSTQGIYFGSVHQNYDDFRFLSVNNTVDVQTTSNPIGDTNWHLIGVTADRDGLMQLWKDGVSVQSSNISSSTGQNWNRLDDTYKIGTDRSETGPIDGLIDEIRVSKVVRSSDWIATEFNNTNDPTEFITVETEQGIGAPIISGEQPLNDATGVSVSLGELSFEIQDADSPAIDFSVVTTPDVGSRSEVGVPVGIYTVPISALNYDTTYTWTISATDGEHPIVRDFTFSTEIDDPVISNEDPRDGALNVAFDPTLKADILDYQGDSVDWEIEIYLNDAWQLLNSGTLLLGEGTVSVATSSIDAYAETYIWRVRARETGSESWLEKIYSFTTIDNKMSFAAFTDTHIGARMSINWGMADYLDEIAQDIMDNTDPCDFVVHLGDQVMYTTAQVQGEGLPSQYDQYLNNLKAYLIEHVNMPYMAVSGNHDMVDYYGADHPSFPQNNGDPFNLIREIIDATELNSYPYAFMN
jgi:hypothetical protein